MEIPTATLSTGLETSVGLVRAMTDAGSELQWKEKDRCALGLESNNRRIVDISLKWTL